MNNKLQKTLTAHILLDDWIKQYIDFLSSACCIASYGNKFWVNVKTHENIFDGFIERFMANNKAIESGKFIDGEQPCIEFIIKGEYA